MKEIHIIGSGNAFHLDGRAHACYLLTSTAGDKLLLDFGATSLMRLHQEKVDVGAVDALLLTHFHGDHLLGLPFLLIYFDLILKRGKDFLILGPTGVEAAVKRALDTAYPGFVPGVPIVFQEVTSPAVFRSFHIQPFPITHRPESTGYRITGSAGRTMAFSGDSAFDAKLFELVRGVEVALVELSMEKQEFPPVSHVALDEIEKGRANLDARRVVFTHIYDTLADIVKAKGLGETASDGQRILFG